MGEILRDKSLRQSQQRSKKSFLKRISRKSAIIAILIVLAFAAIAAIIALAILLGLQDNDPPDVDQETWNVVKTYNMKRGRAGGCVSVEHQMYVLHAEDVKAWQFVAKGQLFLYAHHGEPVLLYEVDEHGNFSMNKFGYSRSQGVGYYQHVINPHTHYAWELKSKNTYAVLSAITTHDAEVDAGRSGIDKINQSKLTNEQTGLIKRLNQDRVSEPCKLFEP